MLQSTAAFITLPQQATGVSKPSPPLAIPLPADVFYPFVTGSSAAQPATASWAILVLVAAVGLAAMQGLLL